MEYEPNPSTDPVIFLPGGGIAPTVSGFEGSYRVIRLLGRGTMSSVYLAEQVSMARQVALKILSPVLASDPEFVERFHREARASARLNHPNIVSAFDFGEFEARFFLAMEFVDGATLASILSRDGALNEKRVLEIGLQVVSALAHAFGHQVIHLDVKPANIMISTDGRVKLTDFGLAMILEGPGSAEASRRAVGTPYYMAPEQVEGGKLDWRTDQFSLGASLYEAVTGTKPFQGNSVSDILVKRFFEKPEPAWKAGRRKAGRELSAVLAKMMARSPEARYQSFSDLEDDLARVRSGKKPLVARLSSVSSPHTPSASAWDSLGDATVIARVDGAIWGKRWNWFIYSSLLFLALLALYVVMHAREIVGPTPHGAIRHEYATEAEGLEQSIQPALRESWNGAMRLMMRAELDPSEDNYIRAIYSYRLILNNRAYADTAYAAAARRRVANLEEALRAFRESLPEKKASPEDMPTGDAEL